MAGVVHAQAAHTARCRSLRQGSATLHAPSAALRWGWLRGKEWLPITLCQRLALPRPARVNTPVRMHPTQLGQHNSLTSCNVPQAAPLHRVRMPSIHRLSACAAVTTWLVYPTQVAGKSV